MKPNQRATVYTLLERNTPQREIARITGIDRKTVRSYQRRWLAERSNSPGVATGSVGVGGQNPPPWPPASTSVDTSLCDPHRDFIEAQLRLKRNAVAIHQDLVDQYGFAGQYNSVKRFVAKLRHKEPEQFDRLSFLPGEEMQVDYGEGAPTRVRDPNRKGTVENANGHTQATALKGRRFESIEAQNEFLAHWVKNWAAKRIHGTERRQVQAMFEEERPHLKALPLLGMRYFSEAQRTVCDDSCVRVDHSSYAARPAAIGSKVLVRIYAQHIELRDIRTGELLRTHAKAVRPGSVVLPLDERVFNPSRETRQILRQASEVGEHAARLCQLLFAIEGRVGQRKLWGIVGLARRYPAHCVNTACAQLLAQGIYSYKRVQALTEALYADALHAIEAHAGDGDVAPTTAALTHRHGLIRAAHEYGDLFAHAAASAMTTATATHVTTPTSIQGGRA